MRMLSRFSLALTALVLAGCTQTRAPSSPQATAFVAEMQAEAAALGAATTAITVAASMDPSGMAAGPAHAVTRGMVRARVAQTNARLQSRAMAEQMAVMKCLEGARALSGAAEDEYFEACTKRARGTP